MNLTFEEAVKFLGIEDYQDRIWKSNSHGELFHLQDYICFAGVFKDDAIYFKKLFEFCVEFAEKEWTRPESCFQHMPALIGQLMDVGIQKGHIK